MFNNILILCAAAGGAASILTILIKIYHDYFFTPSPSEVLKQKFTVENAEVLNMIEETDKCLIMTINEARTKSGLEPFNEFQKVAHNFGETKTSVYIGGSTIRRATNCPNCGANLTQNGVCVYCGTTYN